MRKYMIIQGFKSYINFIQEICSWFKTQFQVIFLLSFHSIIIYKL